MKLTQEDNYLGRHLIVELYGCEADRSSDVNYVENIMNEAAKLAGAQVVSSLFHKFGEMGVAGVVIINESYYGIRTCPEIKYVGIDLYASNENTDNKKALEFLIRKFGATKYSASELQRGSKSEA